MYKILFDMRNDINDLKKLTLDLMKTGDIEEVEERNHQLIEKIYADQERKENNIEVMNIPQNSSKEKEYDFIETIEEDESLSLQDKEIEMIKKSLGKNNNKRKLAAKELGISEEHCTEKLNNTIYNNTLTFKFMKKIIYIALFAISSFFFVSCGIYGFTGGDVGSAKTIQVDFFPNQAQLIEPVLSQDFTIALQDLFTRQTNLTLISSNGDLRFSGEITSYRIAPMSATSQQTSAQNRLTITVNVRYENNTDDQKNFEQSFSFYSDYAATSQLTGGVLEAAFNEIIDRLTQDIFNASVGKW